MNALPWLLLFLPLLSAAVILLATLKNPRLSAAISVAAVTAMFVISLILLGAKDSVSAITWIDIPGMLTVDIGLKIDWLSRGMALTVAVVGMLVHIYSLGYMAKDDGKARYFAGLSIFMFSMMGIVLAGNFVMMFIFWELVGVSSYILIGHWFDRDAAADAAKKAFITNRIGDFGFMIGILLVWTLGGSIVFGEIDLTGAPAAWLAAAALLVFCGAVGKSAQFPLHVWLPDAMEGPTPVSALIHAATMVAAGVYMLARAFVVIEAAPDAAIVIAWVGGITALLAALMATQQNDIKRILAYSTLSQLGYMVMAIGLLARDAALFHLFTHAFFKALLFLGAGAVIHALHHEQDIWKMGGLSGRMRGVFLTFAAGTAALVAFPFVTSGWYSKEAILAAAHAHTPLFILGALVAFLTPFYMVRLVTVAFMGDARTDAAREAHDAPKVMLVPLIALAIPSLIAGWSFFYGPVFHFPHLHDPGRHSIIVPIVSIACLVAGAGLAFMLYRGRSEEPLKGPVFTLFARKFYIDEIYAKLIGWFQDGLATFLHFVDDIFINGIGVRGISKLTAGTGNVLRNLQAGNLQAYAFIFGLGAILLIYFLVFS